MADTTNLSEFLEDVADAIRTKKGTNLPIPAANFDTEILAITTVNNQNKSVTPSTSQQTIQADNGYTGLGTVTVSAVDNSIDSNITTNNIKKNVTILGVTGTLEEGTDVSNVTATAGDVRETKTFVNSNGEEVQGTFPDATAVYEEISDSSAINKDRLSLDSATSYVYNACYFDNTWYQVDGSNLIIKNSLETKTVALAHNSSDRCFISVGCKDYFGENTLIIAIGGYWSAGDHISMYLYNYETNTLTYKYDKDKGLWDVRPCVHPTRPYLLTTDSYTAKQTYGDLKVSLWQISNNGSTLTAIKNRYNPLSGDTTPITNYYYEYCSWISDRAFDFGYISMDNSYTPIQIPVSVCTCICNGLFTNTTNATINFAKRLNYNMSYCMVLANNNLEIHTCLLDNNDITINSTIIGTVQGNENSYFIGNDVIVADNDSSITLYMIENEALTEIRTISYVSYRNRFLLNPLLRDGDDYIFSISVGTTEALTSFIYNNKSYLDTSYANATASDILLNKTAYVNGVKITGTMPNNGTLSYTPSTSQQTIPAGYTSGGIIDAVTLTDADYDTCLDLTEDILGTGGAE